MESNIGGDDSLDSNGDMQTVLVPAGLDHTYSAPKPAADKNVMHRAHPWPTEELLRSK